MKTNKRKIRFGCIFLSVMMALGIIGGAFVSAETQTGSFEIYCHGTTEAGERIELSGAEIELYKVGDYTGGEWTLNQEFAPSGADLGDMSASAQREAANILYKYAVADEITGKSGFTDSNGKLTFNEIEIGLYLVAVKDEYRYGEGVFRSAPFLLTMPIETEEGIVFDFTAEPKTEWVPDGQEPTEEPTKPTEPTEEPTEPVTKPTEPTDSSSEPTGTVKPTTPTSPSTSPATKPTGGDSQQTGDDRNTESLAFLCAIVSAAAIVILRRKSTDKS